MKLERKFCRMDAGLSVKDGSEISGYASLFGEADQGGDIVGPGAYASALARLKSERRSIKMLWQHDPAQPIGVWDEVREDKRGLWVKGRILKEVERGREAAALIDAGAIDGLSIGYRTIRSTKSSKGGRLLTELELWEVSLVTFPMLPDARVAAKADDQTEAHIRELAALFEDARRNLAQL